MALGRKSLFTFVVLLTCLAAARAWDSDLELFDLVEEIPHSFYEFLSVPQDASSVEIKKAYRRLSLSLHPDKNKAEDAETQFRQLVAIYEVLKDEERRQRYDDILVNGLPDWRQPVFYYRRVRKMSNAELGFLVFLILTVGHYAVIWSIYLEKQLDEMLSKKKKEKKKKLAPRPAEDPIGQERDRAQHRPHWQDILPLKLSIWLYLSIKALPQTIQEIKQYYEEYKEMKKKEKEEVEAEQDTTPREKRPKVKKPKQEFPVYQPPESLPHTYEQGTSIEDVEEQMDDWLEDGKGSKKKSPEWTEEDLSMLSRSMGKFPGGTPGRWEKIAHDLGRSVSEVTTKVKQVKECASNTSGLVRLSELRSDMEEEGSLRRRNKKSGGDAGEGRSKVRRQRDFDPSAEEEEEEEKQEGEKDGEEEKQKEEREEEKSVWTQNQQKFLEVGLQQYPRGSADRWDRIALLVPGKTKEECMIRYKMLAELVKKRKQAKR